jgi:hypothetical protein
MPSEQGRLRGKTCFFCGAPATGFDHVPPRAFFPKAKDLPAGMPSVRTNLITVPACDSHNGDYSTDDEIASLVLRLTHQANPLAQQDFVKKGIRAIDRSKGLVDALFKSINVYQLPDGREIPTMEFDAARVNGVMERIARGLYFHTFGRRWESVISIAADGPLMADLSPSPLLPALRRMDALFQNTERKGDNPAIFWYQWAGAAEGDTGPVLRMCFYEGFRYIACASTAAAPGNSGDNRPVS